MGYYARYDDDRCQQSGVTVASATADPDYPASNLIQWNPAKPAKLTGTSGAWVVTLPSAQEVRGAALIYQYLDDIDVRIQGNTSDSWVSPAFDASITIPAKRADGPSYQRWTQNPYLIFDTPQTYQYWRLVIVGTNSQAVVVGRLMLLSEIRDVSLRFNGSDIEESDGPPDGLIEYSTELGVDLPIVIGGPRQSLSAFLIASDLYADVISVAEALEYMTLFQSIFGGDSLAGSVQPFLLIPREDRNDARLVRPDYAGRRSHKEGNWEVWPFTVREVSRGLPWP